MRGFNQAALLNNPFTNPPYFQLPRENDTFAIPSARTAADFPIPPPEVMQYKEPPDRHLESGKRDSETLRRALSDAGYDPTKATRFLEFGCANSRVLRHLADWAEHAEGWGVDINARTLLWSAQNLSPPFKYLVTTTVPHLPFEDRSFSLVYAYSIFTHIGELWTTWLAELHRILEPGAFVFITIHDEAALGIIRPNTPLEKIVASVPTLVRDFKAGEIDMFCVRQQVFIRREHFLRRLGDFFEHVSITERTMGTFQTGVLARKS